jgi:hypothetical protein
MATLTKVTKLRKSRLKYYDSVYKVDTEEQQPVMLTCYAQLKKGDMFFIFDRSNPLDWYTATEDGGKDDNDEWISATPYNWKPTPVKLVMWYEPALLPAVKVAEKIKK